MTERTSSVVSLNFGDSTYGDATTAIRRVIRSSECYRWFRKVDMDDRATEAVRNRLTRHFEILGETVTAQSLVVDFVQGGWNVLAEMYRTVNPAGKDPAYGRGKWREALDVIAGDIRRELERSRPKAIVPPLFPVAGNAGIVARMLTTEMGGASVVSDEIYRQTVWYMMCDVDGDFWSAMIWPLSYEDRRDENPFEELVAMYLSGFYPLGFVGERFIVYSYA